MNQIKKLMPLLALFALLSGCTGGCNGGVNPVNTPSVIPSQPPETETIQPTPTPVAVTPPAKDETAQPIVSATPRPSPLPSPMASRQPAPTPPPAPTPVVRPDDTAVLEAYQQAVEVYAWFHMSALPCDVNDSVVIDDITYWRVDYLGITSLTDLRGTLKRLFSDELVDALMSAGSTTYREVDGVLYVLPTARGADMTKGGEQRQVLWQGDSQCVVQVVVELLDPEQDFAVVGTETHTFPYQRVGSQWIFTEFYLVR